MYYCTNTAVASLKPVFKNAFQCISFVNRMLILTISHRHAKLRISKDQHQPIALDLKYRNQIFKMPNLSARYVAIIDFSSPVLL